MGRRKKKKTAPAESEPLTSDQLDPEPTETPEDPGTVEEPAGEPEEAPVEETEEQPEAVPVETSPQIIVRCPVCDGSGEETDRQGDLVVCKCEKCGLRFRNPRPSAAEIAKLRESFFEGSLLKAHGRDFKEQAVIAEDIMRGFHLRSSGRRAVLNAFGRKVLDVNCGLGLRLREFQKYGWDVYGLDTSKSAVQYAKGCALDAREGWIDTAGFGQGMFDLVIFNRTFDDQPDPLGAVKSADEILKDSGFVYVRLDETATGEFPAAGFFRFDPDSLRRVFMEHGFTVILENNDDAGYYFWFKKKERKVKDASDQS